MPITHGQTLVLIILERSCASLSVAGILLVLGSLAISKRLRTLPNTFIVLASIANLLASIACLVGYEGVYSGPGSALCQAQAFLLQTFMQSDPWWSLAMAVNVFLAIFGYCSTEAFLKKLWVYCLVCYGGPAVSAIALLLVSQETKPRIYGDATLWCWISHEWQTLRIYTYYIPVWVCVVLSMVIYFAVGYRVFHQRNELKHLRFRFRNHGVEHVSFDIRSMHDKSVVKLPSYNEIATIKTQVGDTGFDGPTEQLSTLERSVTHQSLRDGNETEIRPWNSGTIRTVSTRSWKQPKYSLLAMPTRALKHFQTKLACVDPVKRAYLGTSLKFGISVFVTWTPSSINRVYSIAYPDDSSFPLFAASSVVLPLQGVWNAIIYFTSNGDVVKEEYVELASRRVLLPGGA